MTRRRLFDGEVGVQVDNAEHMELLAQILDIQADGGDTAGDFVAFAIKKLDSELRAKYHERRARELRNGGSDSE